MHPIDCSGRKRAGAKASDCVRTSPALAFLFTPDAPEAKEQREWFRREMREHPLGRVMIAEFFKVCEKRLKRASIPAARKTGVKKKRPSLKPLSHMREP